MKDIYRCSCCNELKNAKTNIIYAKWDTFKTPPNCSLVGICRKCNNDMKKVSVNRVEQFLRLEE